MIRPALTLLALLTLITGVIYPLTITGLAQVLFPHQANGSLVRRDGRIEGSELIGRCWDGPRYFQGRPSAVSCDASVSGGSNWGPSNPTLHATVSQRVATWRQTTSARIPVELVTASGSGLDPHLTPPAAALQVSRVARARGLTEAQVYALVLAHTEDRQLGVLGEPRVNVLKLNLALDAHR